MKQAEIPEKMSPDPKVQPEITDPLNLDQYSPEVLEAALKILKSIQKKFEQDFPVG